ncbi:MULTISPECIES: LysR family transcriptional regulator [Cupriavidus]|uniref:LysR family transcriptional regulator n=1 Tax=Cupriavidus pauculus TaxID=82633 RepID=A0A3G8H5T4_9BURK|nr:MULTISPECIES: LysR family transcriptional regulator [Cupriavidus]AZG15887.1 LysR family transcriptional regulator [Cupriavidus pauculus]MDT6963635.1 LysR family transcriptional regulator [Cupriavidus sp. SZY C1]
MDAFSDVAFFMAINRFGSMAAAAQELGVTPSAVSKRLLALESRLGVRLLNRTTRRISLTPEGESYLVEGGRILAELETLERAVAGNSSTPHGLLKIGATLGFGRRHIAPALAAFAQAFPKIEIQLYLSERPLNLTELGLDAVIHFGDLPDVRLTARLLANNRRLLVAAPSYLARAGLPATPRDLSRHSCIFIREADETFGTWHLRNGTQQETVKVRGTMSTNDGESAVIWALEGQGLVVRSEWDIADHLRNGSLCRVLPQWHFAPADIHLVYSGSSSRSDRIRVLVDFLLERFEAHRQGRPGGEGRW